MFWGSASVGVCLVQLVENFSNGFGLGNESGDAQGPTALTFQRVDLIHTFDEPCPRFSKSGAFFGERSGGA